MCNFTFTKQKKVFEKKKMKTIKITNRSNGVITSVKEVELSDEAFEKFSNKIDEIRKRKEERMKKNWDKVTPELIDKLKEMNKNKSPG